MCARCCAKYLTCINSFNPHNRLILTLTFLRLMLLLSPSYLGTSGTYSSLQIAEDRARNCIWTVSLQSLDTHAAPHGLSWWTGRGELMHGGSCWAMGIIRARADKRCELSSGSNKEQACGQRLEILREWDGQAPQSGCGCEEEEGSTRTDSLWTSSPRWRVVPLTKRTWVNWQVLWEGKRMILFSTCWIWDSTGYLDTGAQLIWYESNSTERSCWRHRLGSH